MGSLEEWLLAVLLGALWGGWSLAWETRKRRAASLQPALLPASVYVWIASGLVFGIFLTFHWRAIHRPLIFITLPVIALWFATIWLTRRARAGIFVERASWMKVVSFFALMVGLALLLFHKAWTNGLGFVCLSVTAVLWAVEYFQSKRQKKT